MATAPTRRPRFTLHDARRTDTRAFMNLIALADPGNPDPFGMARQVLALPHQPPLSHPGLNLCLLARDGHGAPVGALLAGVPRWILDHPAIGYDVALMETMVEKIGMIHGVAVRPGHRGRGIGRALIAHAEQRFTRAGYDVMTLNHDGDHDAYYTHLGYTVTDMLVINLPVGLVAQTTDDTRMCAKPLTPRVKVIDVPGAPAPIITGVLPDTDIPEHAWFDGRTLHM